jgi:hypothetical protein
LRCHNVHCTDNAIHYPLRIHIVKLSIRVWDHKSTIYLLETNQKVSPTSSEYIWDMHTNLLNTKVKTTSLFPYINNNVLMFCRKRHINVTFYAHQSGLHQTCSFHYCCHLTATHSTSTLTRACSQWTTTINDSRVWSQDINSYTFIYSSCYIWAIFLSEQVQQHYTIICTISMSSRFNNITQSCMMHPSSP